jgi:DNA-binding LacI/PurR family transcriptional regulator
LQSNRVRRIGVIGVLAEDDPETIARRAGFEQALQVLGWTGTIPLKQRSGELPHLQQPRMAC